MGKAASTARETTLRLAIIDADDEAPRSALRLAARLKGAIAGSARIVVMPCGSQSQALVGPDADVVAIRLGTGDGRALACALQMARVRPWLQFVFWYEGRALCPEVEVARSLGLEPVLSETQARRWLIDALPALVRHARARKELLAAEAAIPDPPRAGRGGRRTGLSLPQAEQQFREIFLRGVLASSSSFKQAALLAGIPYTSFYSMVQKFSIRPAGDSVGARADPPVGLRVKTG